jgi:hypothetical protein
VRPEKQDFSLSEVASAGQTVKPALFFIYCSGGCIREPTERYRSV